MSDEDNRRAERAANANGTTALEEAKINANATRAGTSLAAILARFVGRWIYAETYKMNYRGLLAGVVTNGAGDPTALLFSILYRTGEWGNQPDATYEENMEASEGFPRVIQWDSVTDFGLQQTHWPKSGPPRGSR